MDMMNESCSRFLAELASKAPTPGGGGTAALVGAAGVALGNMVGCLTVGKKKYAAVEADILTLNERAGALRGGIFQRRAGERLPAAACMGVGRALLHRQHAGGNRIALFPQHSHNFSDLRHPQSHLRQPGALSKHLVRFFKHSHLSVIDHQYPVRDSGDVLHAMGNQQNSIVPLPVIIHNLRKKHISSHWIKSGGRLV